VVVVGDTIETEAFLAAKELGIMFLKERITAKTNKGLKSELNSSKAILDSQEGVVSSFEFNEEDEEPSTHNSDLFSSIEFNEIEEKLSKHKVDINQPKNIKGEGVETKKHLKKKKRNNIGVYLINERLIPIKNGKNEKDIEIKKKHACNICGIEFKRVRHLSKHFIESHPGMKIPCELCSKHFSSVGSKETHIKIVHTNGKSFPCDKCGKFFTTSGIRKTHTENVHGENKLIVCQQCDKSFSTAGTLKTHIEKTHNAGPPLPCPHCGRFFQYMEQHIQHKHEVRSASFTCEECGKNFKFKNDVSRHKKVHLPYDIRKALKEKKLQKHQCNLCGKRFPDSTRLKTHDAAKHTGIKKFYCQRCPKSYFRSDHLKTHVSSNHGLQN